MFHVEEQLRPEAGADCSLMVRDQAGRQLASCSLWTNPGAILDGQRVGFIGHYKADDRDAAARLLDEAAARLAAVGVQLAVGPMDGSTWHSYRLVTGGSEEPPFLLEQFTPPEWVQDFEAAAFEPLARYRSALEAPIRTPDVARAHEHLRQHGLQAAPLSLEHPETALDLIWRLSLNCFADNFLYTPIGREEFMALYLPVLPMLDPRLTLLCTDRDGTPVGFLFALPDLLRPQRDTVIVKTLAVLPHLQGRGIGSALSELIRDAALGAGYQRMIHALFHEANRSGRISAHTGQTLREYTLFARRLGPTV